MIISLAAPEFRDELFEAKKMNLIADGSNTVTTERSGFCIASSIDLWYMKQTMEKGGRSGEKSCDEYFMENCRNCKTRSTCLRRQVGAVIVG